MNFNHLLVNLSSFLNSLHSEDIWRITLGVICGIFVLHLFLSPREKTAGVRAERRSQKVKVRSQKVKVLSKSKTIAVKVIKKSKSESQKSESQSQQKSKCSVSQRQ